MLTDNEITDAANYVEKLRLFVHNLSLPDNNRVRAAGACFSIAQEHHHAIIQLMELKLFASAFALLRVEFEAYIRGEWLLLCAKEKQIEDFFQGKEPPKINELLKQLETFDVFNKKELSKIKQNTWKQMCAYTHTGGLHIQNWSTEDGIESNYKKKEILQALMFAEIFASLAVIGVAGLASDEKLAERIFEDYKCRFK